MNCRAGVALVAIVLFFSGAVQFVFAATPTPYFVASCISSGAELDTPIPANPSNPYQVFVFGFWTIGKITAYATSTRFVSETCILSGNVDNSGNKDLIGITHDLGLADGSYVVTSGALGQYFFFHVKGGQVFIDDAPFEPAPGCFDNCNDNVLFIPGLEASRLYDGNGNRLWEPGSNADAEELRLNPDGTSVRGDIVTRDPIDNAYVPLKGNVYQSFIADMNSLKANGVINDWAPTPYDWRFSIDQILASGNQSANGISYMQATSTPYIEQQLRHLADTSRTKKSLLLRIPTVGWWQRRSCKSSDLKKRRVLLIG